MSLEEIEIGTPQRRGKCTICGRRSYRWYEWKNVERWYAKHKCDKKAA